MKKYRNTIKLFDTMENEYLLENYYKLRPAWKAWLDAGVGGLLGAKFAKTEKLNPLIGIPFGIFLLKYNEFKNDTCSNLCGSDEDCYYECYIKAIDKTINRITDDLKEVSKLKNPEVKKTVSGELNDQLTFYKEKRLSFLKLKNS